MLETNSFRPIGPTTYLSPIPSVLVGCADPANGIKPNLITVAWAGVVCTRPPMVSVSIRKERYSHAIISRTGEFTVNLVGKHLLKAMGLTPVAAPGLEHAVGVGEAPAFRSCKVHQVIELGSHDLFIGAVQQVSVADRYFRPDGSINEEAMNLISFVHGKYHAVSEPLGFFGYSVASPKALERRGFGKGKKK